MTNTYHPLDRQTLIGLLQRRDAERDFFHLRELGGRLQSAGSFDLDRMRFA